MKTNKILIAGAGGLVGSHLCNLLINSGFEINTLSRNPNKNSKMKAFKWDIDKNYIDKNAFTDISGIINLAGENIGTGRWTKKKKKKISDSRINGTKLLVSYAKKLNLKLNFYISASATGYYQNSNYSNNIYNENSPAGTGFLSDVCVKWEKAALEFKDDLNTRVSIIRTGIVQSQESINVKKMKMSSNLFIIPILGKGEQSYPWIHIDDLCKVYLYSITNQSSPMIINATTPEVISNADYCKAFKKYSNPQSFMIKVPEFLIKLIFGRKSEILTKGVKVSTILNEKNNFNYSYKNIEACLKSIL